MHTYVAAGAFFIGFSTATSAGWSTTEIAERLLPEYKLDRFQVLRRIKRMNKRLEAEMGKPVAERREHRWVMTRYVQRRLVGWLA